MREYNGLFYDISFILFNYELNGQSIDASIMKHIWLQI
jgi:hypothetical protein